MFRFIINVLNFFSFTLLYLTNHNLLCLLIAFYSGWRAIDIIMNKEKYEI